MTPNQNKRYWAEWNAAKKAGHLEDSDRYTIMEEALVGTRSTASHISSKDLTNEDLDKVLAAFRAISEPADLTTQVRALDQPIARLLHSIALEITCLGQFIKSPWPYANSIIVDKGINNTFLTTLHTEVANHLLNGHSLTTLTPDPKPLTPSAQELLQVRNTLHRCVQRKRQAANLTEHQMYQRANLPCARKTCAQCAVGTRSTASQTKSAPHTPELATHPF